MKIGITCREKIIFPGNIRIFTNGHHFNVLLWYHFFEKCGFEVVFLSPSEKTRTICNNGRIYNVINYVEYINKSENKILELDCLFMAGLVDESLSKYMKEQNIYIIFCMMGNNYINDIDTFINDKGHYKNMPQRDMFNEIWISPHFEYTIEYYKIRYRMDNIIVGPYIWSDLLVKGNPTQIYNKGEKLNIAICEPNLSRIKNSIIPLCICERGRQYINKLRCYSTRGLREQDYFISFAKTLNISKNTFFNDRINIIEIFDKCNCVVSTTQECDLNYIFLECFYFGIPLIHNSKMLQDYGYYYPDLDIMKGVEQIKKVVETHNTKLYIEKHKPLLHKYSIENTYYQEWVKDRILKHDTIKGYQFIVITGSDERKQLMEEQFHSLNVPVDVHYLEASFPSNSQDYLKDCGKEESEHGFICCSHSHIRALEYASKNKDKYTHSIILEDDVAFLKEDFINKIKDIINNWNKYIDCNSKMITIGWVPTNNYEHYEGYNKSNITINLIRDKVVVGTQGYIVKNNDIPYLEYLVQPTYIKMDKKVKHSHRWPTILARNPLVSTHIADHILNLLFRQIAVYPPMMIEIDIPSMLGHNNKTDYWDKYFKGHEEEKNKYNV